jgi:Flp pilus assembly protein TadD
MSRVPRTTVAAASAETITANVQCVRCGYNLRGLTPEKICPECGTPVGRSVHSNLLRYSDPHWLGKLRLGAALVLWNIVIAILLGGAAITFTLWRFPPMAEAIGSSIAAALVLWAIILVTTREPRISHPEDPVTLRRFVRLSATAGFVGTLVAALGPYLGGGAIVLIVVASLQLAGIVAYFGQFVYLRRFARRIPNGKLARSTTIVMWGFVLAYGLIAVSRIMLLTGGALAGDIPAGATSATTQSATSGPATTVFVKKTTSFDLPSLGAIGGMAAFACLSLTSAPSVLPLLGAIELMGAFAGIGVVTMALFAVWYGVLLVRYCQAFKKASQQAGRLTGTGTPAGGRAAVAAPAVRPEDDPQIAKYNEALEREPDSPAAHYNLAVVLAAKGFGAEAAKHYTEALRLDPGYLQARHNLANVLFKQGIVDQAVRHYTELLRIEPDFPTAHYNLANILLTQGKTDEAITHFTEAVRLRPDYAEARYYLGTTLEGRGDTAPAVQEFRAVLQIDPNHAKARAKLDAAEDAGHGPMP